jgi:leader peptidase (prepilin peptidase)/N-methyltransferase
MNGGEKMDSMIIKGYLFVAILIVAGYIDIKTKTIPDYIHVLIIIVGLINIDLVESLIWLVIVPLPFFIMACLKENSIGGGDIKLVGACGFFLGVTGGFVGSIIGLLMALVVKGVYFWIEKKDNSIGFALAPFLGCGNFIVLLIYT